jgi:putative NIF3 family GTP cyclohydrolase 1 type 2
MTIAEVAALIEDHAPLSLGVAGDELGLLVGDPNTAVTGVVTCWSPTLAILRQAVQLGANLVIGHEPLLWPICGRDPEAGLKWYDERHVSAKIPNQKRLEFCSARGLSVYRYHSNWDWAPQYGQVDMLASILGLGDAVDGERECPIYEIVPETVGAMLARARETFSLGPVRVVGDLQRQVSRIAICQGGFGQMFTFPEIAAEHGAELALFGEMLDYTIRYCVEVDLPAIELGHCQSEHPGMMGMAEMLRERLPEDIPVQCLHSGEPWQVL